ncbi:MAG: hypothetical protein C5B51_12545 [Terriglobia bacterium]|nr:MAG: hypothetical protein C5B51_12545 [Terriglobia bacterium]
MIRDCRANRAEGWAYFISNYVPVTRTILTHYFQPDAAGRVMERILLALRQPESSLFASVEPVPERPFVAELRQHVLALAERFEPAAAPEITVDLETLATALEPLSVVEKQAAWLETMRYAPGQSGTLLRMAPVTVEKIRERAAELIRHKTDAWRRTLLWDNGLQLGRAAAASSGSQCLPAKIFLDVLDGRSTWRGREDMEHHVRGCWHCIDRFCRLVEVVELLRANRPLTGGEAEPLRKLFGVATEKRPAWKRLFGQA